MYNFNRLIFFIIFLIFYLLPDIYSQNIEVKVSLDKSEYYMGQPIYLKIIFKNISNKIDSINSYQFQEYYSLLSIINSKGKPPISHNMITESYEIRYLKISPGQVMHEVVELQQYLGYIALSHTLCGKDLYFDNDEYTMQYIGDKNNLISNKIDFKVLKPETSEMDNFETLLYAHQIPEFVGNTWMQDSVRKKRDTYISIFDTNPKSIYVEEAIYGYNMCSRSLGVDSSLIHYNSWFIDNFPNSNYLKQNILYNVCHAIFHFSGGKDSVNKFLNEIIENYPNSFASEIAAKYLVSQDYLK